MLPKNEILGTNLQHLWIYLSFDVATLQSFDLATLQFVCQVFNFNLGRPNWHYVINSKRGANNHTRCAVKAVGWVRMGWELAGGEGDNIDA